jgi:hypothetical protein
MLSKSGFSLFPNALSPHNLTSTPINSNIDWSLYLNQAIETIQRDGDQVELYRTVKKIILITNLVDTKFVDSVGVWCGNPK